MQEEAGCLGCRRLIGPVHRLTQCLGRAARSNGALAAVNVDRLTIHVRGEIRQKEHGDSRPNLLFGEAADCESSRAV